MHFLIGLKFRPRTLLSLKRKRIRKTGMKRSLKSSPVETRKRRTSERSLNKKTIFRPFQCSPRHLHSRRSHNNIMRFWSLKTNSGSVGFPRFFLLLHFHILALQEKNIAKQSVD